MAASSEPGVVERVGFRISEIVERWMPSPFVFAILLTYLVYGAGLLATDSGPVELLEFWYGGFWAFLGFSMQMVLILMTGFVIAYHPRVNAILQRLAEIPNSGAQAAAFVGFISMSLAWVHWGFSLIMGAIFAREMGKVAHRKGITVHYPLLAVAGYMGLGLTWHWGISGSAPLQLTDANNIGEGTGFEFLSSTIPAAETIFHPYALTLTVLSIIFASAVLYVLAPSGERAKGITEYVDEAELFDSVSDGGTDAADASDPVDEPPAEVDDVPAERMNNSRIIGGLVALSGVAILAVQFAGQGLNAFTLNAVNFGFLFAGLLIYQRPAYYRDRFNEAAGAAAGIVLLFPFFAGIQGIMASSGLALLLAEGLLDVSTAATYPVIAWIVGSVANLFVPSGGGEWLVVGPSVLQAAQELGVPYGQATIAYAVGDAHTNLLNPFWALPLLAITNVRAREMFGYAIAMLIALIPFLAVALYAVPY
ncbi:MULTISPECIES: short-chain fatty acid transporter [Halorubrum]|uniref:Short chain fatty acids transporter n=1 Tax=Halorubrum hochstenium ATCC 700873 TaxID=1227481 RepID=M0FNG8_9EURY|nr:MULTISPECIES: TIGR00366 family protein [Halorubrum]ELZ61566.1 short chain fatty acids transporter [Halorubrum hochstenium ATCC 700873]